MGFETILVLGATLSLLMALLHVGMLPFGARAYRYFTAGDWMVEQAEAGSPWPNLLTLGIAVIFTVFAAYALAGAGVSVPVPVPFPRVGLTVVTAIYLLRGIAVLPQLVMRSRDPSKVALREPWFSAVSLLIGIVHAAGIVLGRNALG